MQKLGISKAGKARRQDKEGKLVARAGKERIKLLCIHKCGSRSSLPMFLFLCPAPDDSSCVHRGAAPRKDAATKSEARFYGSLYLLILESRSDMSAMYDNA